MRSGATVTGAAHAEADGLLPGRTTLKWWTSF